MKLISNCLGKFIPVRVKAVAQNSLIVFLRSLNFLKGADLYYAAVFRLSSVGTARRCACWFNR